MRIKLALLFVCGMTWSAFADWSFDDNLLTATSGRSVGMVLTATLKDARVTVTGIKTRPDGMTVIDLRGDVTKADDNSELSIVSISGLKFTGLTELYLPDQLEEITSNFDGCTTLTTVAPLFPPSFKSCTCEKLFKNTSLTGDVVMACSEMTKWTRCMFENTKITSVDYSKSGITTMADFVCSGCAQLTNVTPFLSKKITSISNCAFAGCTKLKGELVFPNTAITAVPESFVKNAAITSVDFGDCEITTIGASAFHKCSCLTNMVPFLPATVKSIGSAAFHSCAITNALVLCNPELAKLEDQTFNYCGKIPTIDLTGSAIVSIGSYCFQDCNSLTDIRPLLPDTVKQIGLGAFSNITATNMIYLSGYTNTVMPSIFRACKCEGIDMSHTKITTFETACFQYCAFKKVILPETADNLCFDSFRGIEASQGIYFSGPPPTTMHQRAFIGIGDSWTIRGTYVLPKEYRAEWQAYINSDPCLTAELTAAQREKFAIAGLAKPTKSLRMNKDQYDSYPLYLCWWHTKPGLEVIVR